MTSSSAVPPMGSTVIHWKDIAVIPTLKGERRDAFNAPTATLDLFHCHITTLRPGEISSVPHRQPQEELVIVKEGTMEVTIDGQASTAAAGSMFFFASNVLEGMRNVGDGPATYYVLQFFTAKTPPPDAA